MILYIYRPVRINSSGSAAESKIPPPPDRYEKSLAIKQSWGGGTVNIPNVQQKRAKSGKKDLETKPPSTK